jgi:outer membrane protein OmpA-like peptidoglycan-associated protein
MLRRILITIVLFAFANNMWAEELNSNYTLGVHGSYLINMHSADFKAIPDCPSCSPGYKDGSGGGISFGGIFEYKASSWITLSARVSYNDISAKLISDEKTKVIVNDSVLTDGLFEHSIDATLSAITFEPLIKFVVYDKLNFNIGLSLGSLLTKKYSQKEEIIEPKGTGTFADEFGADTKSRRRNEFSGELSKPASLLISPFVGLSYVMPLNKAGSLNLEPEVYYYYGLSNIVDDPKVTSWNANYLRIGIAMKYTLQKETEVIRQLEKKQKTDTIQVPKDLLAKSYYSKGIETTNSIENRNGNIIITTETTTRTDTIFVPRIYELTADIRAVGLDENGKEIQIPKIVIEEFTSNKLKPLLNYIFFDENSDNITNKYKLLNHASAEQFQVNNLYSAETIGIYYHVLNIIGRRMVDNPKAKLRIVGCNSDIGSEKDNLELSINRANKVKDYLTSVWEIDSKRLSTDRRNLPDKPSTPTDESDKIQENRRVEFYSDDSEILSPVFLADTLRQSNPPTVRFFPEIKSEAGVSKWTVTAKQGSGSGDNNMIREGKDNLPKTIDWEIAGISALTPREKLPIDYQIKAVDVMGKQYESKIHSIPFDLVTISSKREQGIKDKIIENFSLILFDFDKSDIIGTNKQIVEFLKKRIKKESTIEIKGYSDRTGDDVYNKRLSEKRAGSVKNAIGSKEAIVIGIGEDKLLYDNTLPEGRFYCRTVDIRIETPIER